MTNREWFFKKIEDVDLFRGVCLASDSCEECMLYPVSGICHDREAVAAWFAQKKEFTNREWIIANMGTVAVKKCMCRKYDNRCGACPGHYLCDYDRSFTEWLDEEYDGFDEWGMEDIA